MRRLVIWLSVLALVGVMVAALAVWLFWTVGGRGGASTVTRDDAGVQALLDRASWVSEKPGAGPVYVVAYRESAPFLRWDAQVAPRLAARGIEVRYILFARADREGLTQSSATERALAAELWLGRDWSLLRRWMASAPDGWAALRAPSADADLARRAVVDAGRDFDAELRRRLHASGVGEGYPLLIWRDGEGRMRACACADPRAWNAVERELIGAPSPAPPPPEPSEPGASDAEPAEATTAVRSGPTYPDLEPPPAAASARPPAPAPAAPRASSALPERIVPPARAPQTQTQSQPRARATERAAPATSRQPRRAPEARRDEESVFY